MVEISRKMSSRCGDPFTSLIPTPHTSHNPTKWVSSASSSSTHHHPFTYVRSFFLLDLLIIKSKLKPSRTTTPAPQTTIYSLSQATQAPPFTAAPAGVTHASVPAKKSTQKFGSQDVRSKERSLKSRRKEGMRLL